MVFSFFKKQSQKMPERPAVRPKAPASSPLPAAELDDNRADLPAAPLEPLEFSSGHLPPSANGAEKPEKEQVPPQKTRTAIDDEREMAEFDRDFSESSVMAIDVDHDVDPLQADVEQAVVLFANGQEAAARSLLEALIRVYPGTDGLRFWHLLFDLLQVEGDRATFEKLGVEFAELCETSPPTWRQAQPQITRTASGTHFIALQGILTSDAAAPIDDLETAVANKQPAIIDCAKLVGCDDAVAGRLAAVLSRARKTGVEVMLDQPAAFLRRLNERLVAGENGHVDSWLLLLELLQRHGTQEAFEERAVDYAVTFELSPPSWDVRPSSAGKSEIVLERPADNAYYLSGDLKNCRFEDLVPVIELQDSPILDFSGVRRLDFFSAGQLVNRLAPYKAAGREIVIRNPNHLVAELMAVVGLNKQARIFVPKS